MQFSVRKERNIQFTNIEYYPLDIWSPYEISILILLTLKTSDLYYPFNLEKGEGQTYK